MRKHISAVGFLVAAVVAVPAFAETKIAVLDAQQALLESDAYKKMAEQVNGRLKPQRDRLEALTKELQALDAKAQKDSAVMSDADKRKLQGDEQAKLSEYQSLRQSAEKVAQDAQNDLLRTQGPKLEAIVEDLRKQGGYDVILDRKAALSIEPGLDLTKKATERLNAAK